MNSKKYIVRIVGSSPKPYLPNTPSSPILKKGRNPFFSKAANILIGSGTGLTAGVIIYLMLKVVGANFGGLESSIIIGLPSFFGILTSLVIF